MIPVEIRGAAERHLADDELVRQIDDELDPAEVDRVEAHLAGCGRCRAALAELEVLSARFSAALPLADRVPHVPTVAADRAPAVAQRRSRAWVASPVWRAAAAIALLAGLALAIAPVRAWMAERLGLATRPAEEAPAVMESGGNDSPDDGLRIAFVPEGDRFVVRVSQPQSTGSLTLAAAAGDSASAEIAGDRPSAGTVEGASVAADLLVLPDGLGIRNDASSTADYRVTVPGGLTRVEVRVADRVAWTGSPQLLAEGVRTIPLR